MVFERGRVEVHWTLVVLLVAAYLVIGVAVVWAAGTAWLAWDRLKKR